MHGLALFEGVELHGTCADNLENDRNGAGFAVKSGDGHNGDSVEHQVAQADIANADGALTELGVGLGKAGQRVGVADRVEVLQTQAVADELHAQRCNEGCNAPVGNDEAMGRADDAQ